MRLGDLEMRALLPSWMREDGDALALARGVDAVMRDRAPRLAVLSVWDALDGLPEAYLDELARSLDIGWYDSGADRATKAELVRQSDLVHARLGTVDAVEAVVSTYFGTGRVMEWHDYAGLPHHFKVFTTNPSAVGENLVSFLDVLQKVKRLSSKLDGVMIGLTGEQTARVGVGTRLTAIERFRFTGKDGR